MPYDSTISFTLDTICPWTYLAFLRLNKAILQYTSSHSTNSPVTFTLKFLPYQLYPDFPKDGLGKYDWYKKERYNDSAEKMKMYTAYMGSLGEKEGVTFDLEGGEIANTFEAHRVLQWVQEEKGAEAGRQCLDSLYSQYFTQCAHPSSPTTLITALKAAGVSEAHAKALVDDEYESKQETKMLIQEQAGNGVDSVPYIIIEGRRRDFTLVGAKEVDDYVKALEQVGKEA